MKSLIILLTLFVCAVPAIAQYDIVERRLDVQLEISDVLATEEGYYVLGLVNDKEEADNVITNYYTAKLVFFDRNFQKVWEKSFERNESETLKSAIRIGNRLYLSGTSPSNATIYPKAWVICLSLNGNVLWEQRLGFPNNQITEGIRVYDTGNGDIVLHAHTYRTEYSPGRPVLYRLHSDGSLAWKQAYGLQYYYPHFYYGTQTSDGNLVLVGQVFPTESSLYDNAKVNGFIAKIDISTGKAIWENRYTNMDYMPFSDVIEGNSGELIVVSGSGTKGYTRQARAWIMDANGQILDQKAVPHEGRAGLENITFDPNSGKYFSIGAVENINSDPEQKTILAVFDSNYEVLDAIVIDSKNQYKITNDIDGSLIAIGRKSLLFIK
jgi:hypothetical protein